MPSVFVTVVKKVQTRRWRPQPCGFTLIELLVGVAVFMLIMGLLFQVLSSTTDVWKSTTGKVGSFQAARAAFEAVSRNLSQSTLQTYLGYADSSGKPVPLFNPSFTLPAGLSRSQIATQYLRSSELHFLSGPTTDIFSIAGVNGLITPGQCIFFQAPLGFVYDGAYKPYSGLITTCGYYLDFSDSKNQQPSFISSSRGYRSCLVEVLQPAEKNSIYDSTNALSASGAPVSDSTYDLKWLQTAMTRKESRHVVAENIILLLFLPKLSPADEAKKNNGVSDGSFLAPSYAYDSRNWESGYSGNAKVAPYTLNQLPPIVEVVMVALDERSALRLADKYKSQPPLVALGLTSRFANPTDLSGDLDALEQKLQGEGLAYRVFRSDIQIEGAKWSDD